MGAKEPEPDNEPYEPGGRKHQLIDKMSTDDLAAAYGDGVRFRSQACPQAQAQEKGP
jgi:hypothetical protein